MYNSSNITIVVISSCYQSLFDDLLCAWHNSRCFPLVNLFHLNSNPMGYVLLLFPFADEKMEAQNVLGVLAGFCGRIWPGTWQSKESGFRNHPCSCATALPLQSLQYLATAAFVLAWWPVKLELTLHFSVLLRSPKRNESHLIQGYLDANMGFKRVRSQIVFVSWYIRVIANAFCLKKVSKVQKSTLFNVRILF